MEISINTERGFAVLDELTARYKAKRYPYNRPDAIIPQTILPDELREDKFTLANFYTYLCLHMKGRIASLQAFRAYVRMWQLQPQWFDPAVAQWLPQSELEEFIRTHVGIDAKNTSIAWIENSRRMMEHWNGSVLDMVKGVRSWEEALRRFRNKRTKRDRTDAGRDGAGLFSFQPKMVAMNLYFLDWERLLRPRFPYPSPADVHNFRVGISGGIIAVSGAHVVKAGERLSQPWRDFVLSYIQMRREDPIVVSDALWLFSLLMCGNSPATVTTKVEPRRVWKARDGVRDEPEPPPPLFAHADIDVDAQWQHERWLLHTGTMALAQTCGVCPLLSACRFAIPARPYYDKGHLVLRQRPRFEEGMDLSLLREPSPVEVLIEQASLFPTAA